MNLFWRRLFFWILVFVFFLTTPIITAYLMGYRYSIEKGVFIYTGSISFQSNPNQNIDINVNGTSASSETNQINRAYHIEGLKPGKHLFSISSPGFSTWSKEVTVSSGISTEFWNILLTKKNYEQKTFSIPDGSFSFFPSPSGDRVAILSKKNEEASITILERSTGNSQRIFSSPTFSFLKNPEEHPLLWSSHDENFIMIPLESKGSAQEHIFIIQTDTAKTTDLKDIIRVNNPQSARWNPKKSNSILFMSGATLFETSLESSFESMRIADAVGGYDIVEDSVIFLEQKTGILSQVSLKNPERKEQLTTAPPEGFSFDSDIAKNPASFSVYAYDKTRVAVLQHETGDLFFYNKGETGTFFKKISTGMKGVQFSDDGKKILYWNDWEIFTIFTRKWDAQPARAEGDRLEVGRFSNMIEHVQWSKEYQHVIFSSGQDIKIAELDDRGGRNTVNILSLPTHPLKITNLGSQNTLLFLYNKNENDTTNSSVIFSSIIFPEPVGFFNFGA